MLFALATLAEAGPLAACARSWSTGDLVEAIASADQGTSRMDAASLLSSRDAVLARLACVNEPLTGAAIGAVHRVVATAASLEHQDVRIAPALAGMLAADPGYQLSLALYPEGHPIRGLLSHATILLRDSDTRPLITLPSGWLEVDGQHATGAPTARPAVVQEIDGEGRVVETRYLWPEDALGRWEPTMATRAVKTHPRRVPFLVATAASVVATGVLYGAAATDNASFHDRAVTRSDEELSALRNTTNGLTVGWAVAGVLSVGLGVGLVLTW